MPARKYTYYQSATHLCEVKLELFSLSGDILSCENLQVKEIIDIGLGFPHFPSGSYWNRSCFMVLYQLAHMDLFIASS